VLGRDVLLFFEDRDRDTLLRGDRRLRRRLRKAVAIFRPNKPRVTGFEVSFILLCRALERAGQTVHVNDFALARRYPAFPVGIRLSGNEHLPGGLAQGAVEIDAQQIALEGQERKPAE